MLLRPWEREKPAVVFERAYRFPPSGGRTWDLSPDGQRFLMISDTRQPGELSSQTDVMIVQNCFEELKRLAPVDGN